MKLYKLASICVAAVLVLAVWTVSASAFNVTLTDSNSLLKYDTTYGAVTWNVDGTDNLFYESYFYRVGTGAAMELTGGYNSTPIGTNKYGTTYNLGAYGRVRLTQTLSGGTTGSQMSQWITSLDFTPGGEGTAPLYFYTYSDYRLSDTAVDETALYLGSGEFSQYDNLMGLLWSTVIFPPGSTGDPYLPDHYTTRGFNNAGGVPAEAAGNLNDIGYYNGNAIFMTQWNDPVDFHIFRSLSPVPEPSTFLLLGGGLAGLVLFARRRKRE
jgi:hypothetical protein